MNSINSMEKLLQGEEVVFGVESNLTSTSSLTLTPPARTLTSILADALGHTVRRWVFEEIKLRTEIILTL